MIPTGIYHQPECVFCTSGVDQPEEDGEIIPELLISKWE